MDYYFENEVERVLQEKRIIPDNARVVIPVGYYDLKYIGEGIYDLIYEAGFEVFVVSDKIYLTGTVVGMGIYAENDDIAEIHVMNILDIE